MEKSEGIVCHALPFQDHDIILTVFTENEGMIKLFLKKALIRKDWRGAPISPLTRAEFIYTKGKSELFSCREISIINFHIKFRENLKWLEAALEILNSLRTTYCAMNPVPLIYRLCVRFLEAIPNLTDPMVLVSSFRLKILNHEGLLSSEPHPVFSEDEWTIVEQLALNRSLTIFQDLVLPDYLHGKIALFFQDQISGPLDIPSG